MISNYSKLLIVIILLLVTTDIRYCMYYIAMSGKGKHYRSYELQLFFNWTVKVTAYAHD